jgi:hypothetical protein
MISRKTALCLGEVYERLFTRVVYASSSNAPHRSYVKDFEGKYGEFYDFLFAREYPPWFCNKVKTLKQFPRYIKEFIMKLHTGETQFDNTLTWTIQQRERLGQQYLYDLAQDILTHYDLESNQYSKKRIEDEISKLVSSLELDGYVFRENTLLIPETDALEIKEEIGLLETLYTNLNLANKNLTFHFLQLSEEHFYAKKWDDTISNSRKFLESVLREIASLHCQNCKNSKLEQTIYDSPVKIRDYLEKEGLLEVKEKEALAKIYALLSNTGSHPYMAKNDQARLLRQLSLVFSQFVMLRFEGCMKKN